MAARRTTGVRTQHRIRVKATPHDVYAVLTQSPAWNAWSRPVGALVHVRNTISFRRLRRPVEDRLPA